MASLKRRAGLRPAEHVVLLDVGMVAELSREDQRNLVGFFKVRRRRPPLSEGSHLLTGFLAVCRVASTTPDNHEHEPSLPAFVCLLGPCECCSQ